ncbi:Seipin [Plasmodiophora brassicae]|uniref:Seipin n=1 Tax=Plasmodiophora brassicae TaxID=37360 RepID=A0A0G4IRS9_PLABS|nr:hypothetical protein PBRA_006192 [Plasmodiophora brassicae]SPQ96102.1 unnamed protein product [Plasmodiophora brassicae]
MADPSEDAVDVWADSFGEFFRAPLWHLFENATTQLASLGVTSSKLVLQLWLALCVVLVQVAVSLVVYLLVYWWVIPPHRLEKPVYFDFSMRSPVALVSLGPRQWDVPAVTETGAPAGFLRTGLAYDIDVEFSMFDRVIDDHVGMLVLEATALSSAVVPTAHVAHSKRPIEIAKTHQLSRMAHQFIFFIPIALGFKRLDTRLSTRMFERFVEAADLPISKFNVTLITSYDHTGELHLTSAKLVFNVQLTGLRWIAFNLFWPCLVIGVSVLTFAQMLVLVIVIWRVRLALSGRRPSAPPRQPGARRMSEPQRKLSSGSEGVSAAPEPESPPTSPASSASDSSPHGDSRRGSDDLTEPLLNTINGERSSTE